VAVIADIQAAAAEETAAEIRRQGAESNNLSLDVSDVAAVRYAVAAAARQFGRVESS
jgi:NAD(P)-dependent dehydrogenase (short-subunit alcohol dehydrogenase family)